MKKCQLTTNPIQDALRCQEMTKMSINSMPSFVNNVAELLTDFVKYLWYHEVQFRALSEDLYARMIAAKFAPSLQTVEQKSVDFRQPKGVFFPRRFLVMTPGAMGRYDPETN